jgi:signal transduction histidine kinase
MTRNFSISLKNRLSLTYALFTSLTLLILIFIINHFTGLMFTSHVKDNITQRSREIASSIGGCYDPRMRGFDIASVETMGMYFVQEGYIVTLEDGRGRRVWDARSRDMGHCMDSMHNIAHRMEGQFRLTGTMKEDRYPVNFNGQTVGSVNIETYGPFFYTEADARFLTSLNRLLVTAGIVLTLLSVIISILLSRTIAKPILKAAEAARLIAQNYSRKKPFEQEMERGPLIKINDNFKTRELAQLSGSINSLALELDEGERRQRQLTADVAHELRTPLTYIQGSIEAMIDGVYEPSRQQLESCHEEIARLAGLVEDLNTLTGFEWNSITLNKTEFDLAKLLSRTVEQFEAAAREKGISLTLVLPQVDSVLVTADYNRLKQVFINILSNAIKYTDTGGITVTLKDRVSTFADTGTGIPRDDLPHIFERFYRSDKSRTRGTGGAGIGLSIAAAIIASHGGSITAESNGTGAVFIVRL